MSKYISWQKIMFINKASNGSNNICGYKIFKIRKKLNISQRELSVLMQINGIDMDKNAIQRIEAGKRFVTDIELVGFSKVLNTTIEYLLIDS